MAEQKFVKYGDRVMEVPAAFTLDQAKTQMARFFAELADPAVETKKDGGKVTWVFTKKAGKKGGRRNASATRTRTARGASVKRLLAVPADTGLPAGIALAITTGNVEHLPNHIGGFAAGQREEADSVAAARRALLELLPAHGAGGSLL
jgi:hypothetical protein